ncbi:MAG: signal peptidase I [Gammaproteobacteria bacterium]|nr:signal peptidase I [Gammaproteobacteria bacterium]
MNRMQRIWLNWRGLIYFAILMLGFRAAIADWYLVPTGSMKPTVLEGDYVFTNRLAYQLKFPFTDKVLAQWDVPRRGDIVVFDSPADGTRLLKRVVGLPGDIVQMSNNRVFINGQPLPYEVMDQTLANEVWSDIPAPLLVDEQLGDVHHIVALRSDRYSSYQSFPAVKIPDGEYFMLGDNRDNSGDSRVFGTVPRELIAGRASHVIVSLDWGGSYLPRGERSLRRLH